MKVRPNKFKYLRKFRSKWIKKYKIKFLKYGQWGLKILNYMFLTARHLNRYRIMMHISVRRGSLYKRSMWIRFNISIPLTKKPKGSRMGSGKGKLYAWGFKTFGGTIFFELKNIKSHKAVDFCKQLSTSLNCNTSFVYFKLNPISCRNYGFLNRYSSKLIYWF